MVSPLIKVQLSQLLLQLYKLCHSDTVPIVLQTMPDMPPLHLLLLVPLTTASYSPEAELTTQLLTNYSPKGRPVRNISQAVEVSLGLSLQQILEVDEARGTLTSLVWLNMGWTDEFLVWDEEMTEVSSPVT